MAISDFYNHECDIYRYVKTTISKGYGQTEDVYDYETVPSGVNIKCHFNTKSKTSSLSQREPDNRLSIGQTMVMAIGTDIIIGDKVVNKQNNIEFTVEDVINVRDHHLKVELYRTSKQVSR